MKNPLDIAFAGLVKALFNSQIMRSAIPEGNRISFTDGENNYKATVQAADLPELMLFLSGVGGNLHINADSTLLTVSYTLSLSTGSYSSQKVNELLICTIAVLCNWKQTLHPLQYEGKPFIKDVRINPSPIGLSNQSANRQIKGWAAVLVIEMDLYLNSQTLINAYKVESV